MTLLRGEHREQQILDVEEAEDDGLFEDPLAIKLQQFRHWVREHRGLSAATAGGTALALGLTAGIALAARGGGEDGNNAAANPDRGVATGQANPNVNPTQSSGVFNNQAAGHVILKCTGLTFQKVPGTNKFNVTPQVQLISGDPTSPYLYTVWSTDNNYNVAYSGITTIPNVDPRLSEAFPIVNIIDTAGTSIGPNDPDALRQPTGNTVPDQQIFDCPIVSFPGYQP